MELTNEITSEQAIAYVESIVFEITPLHDQLCISKLLDDARAKSTVLKQVMWERDTAIEQLKELGYGLGEKIRPTVEENKWISVDDGLPKEKGFYSVTIFRENAKLEKLYTRELRFDGKRFDGFLGEKILAWQPLPKPYEPKGDK